MFDERPDFKKIGFEFDPNTTSEQKIGEAIFLLSVVANAAPEGIQEIMHHALTQMSQFVDQLAEKKLVDREQVWDVVYEMAEARKNPNKALLKIVDNLISDPDLKLRIMNLVSDSGGPDFVDDDIDLHELRRKASNN